MNEIEDMIDFVAKEMLIGIEINRDENDFWKTLLTCVYETSLPSFREGVTDFINVLMEFKETYNEYVGFMFRISSRPFFKKAIQDFINGFNLLSSDKTFFDAFSFNGDSLSEAEKVLLFLTVNRSEINYRFLLLSNPSVTKNKK